MLFNCNEGNYTVELDLPAVLKSTVYYQNESIQSNVNAQYVYAQAWVKNPALNTTYPNVTFNFTFPISVINTSGNLRNVFDLNASENKTLNVNAYTNQGVTVNATRSKVEMINSTNYKLTKVFQISNNLLFTLKNFNSTSVTSSPAAQGLINKNWTCQVDKQVVNLTNTENVTLTCFKEKNAWHSINQINSINASINEVNAQITITINNTESESFDLDLNSLLTQSYSRPVRVSSNVSLNAFENKTLNVNITGKFLNTENVIENTGGRKGKILRVWNETSFNIVNAVGEITAESNWRNVTLEVYNNDHYSDVTPSSTCDNFTVFNLESGVWKTCVNQTKYKFVIPHFSTAVIKLSGEEEQITPTPSNDPAPASQGGGSGSGGNGGVATPSITSSNPSQSVKLDVNNNFATPKINENELEIFLPVNGIFEGEIAPISIKVKDKPLNNSIVKFTRPDESVKTQTAENGVIDFFADKQGEWTLEYKGVKKTFIVNTVSALKETTSQAKASNATGFTIATPQVPLTLLVLIALIAVGLFAFKNFNKNTTFKRAANGNKVTLIITNNTNKPMKNLVLTEILSESSKITSESQMHDEYKEMIYGNEYKWRKDVLPVNQTWNVTYETIKPAVNSKCELSYSGINNTTSVIKPK